MRTIDLDLFQGVWYEIARDWVGTTDTYIRNDDGTWLPYRLVYWNVEERTMLATSRTTDYLRLKAKDPVPSPEVYAAPVEEPRRLGFDVSRLEQVPQRPAGALP